MVRNLRYQIQLLRILQNGCLGAGVCVWGGGESSGNFAKTIDVTKNVGPGPSSRRHLGRNTANLNQETIYIRLFDQPILECDLP